MSAYEADIFSACYTQVTCLLTEEVREVRNIDASLAGVTQLVEYLLPKQAVVGSSPIARSENS
jgi:hypothetical protein